MANFNYVTGHIRWAKVFLLVPNYNKDGLEWTFDFVPSEEAEKTFKDLKIDDKLKTKDGVTFMRFTQKEERADGTKNFPITVVDARNRPWDPKIVDGKVTNPIGNDSLVEVKFKVVDYGKGKPTGVYAQAIRVLDLKPFVRQEFEPLPEDSEYVKNCPEVEEFPADDVNDYMPTDGDDAPVEGDPLDG